jgi:hypothetical protein
MSHLVVCFNTILTAQIIFLKRTKKIINVLNHQKSHLFFFSASLCVLGGLIRFVLSVWIPEQPQRTPRTAEKK